MSAGFDTASQAGPSWGGRRSCGRTGWKPIEIVAVVLGFMVHWPIGLAILAWTIARRKGAPLPDVLGAAQDRMSSFASSFTQGQRRPWQPFGEPSSGNAAFDDWRKTELARLEEERRKLEEAEREFSEHMADLRRARDREEFDRFMAQRGNAASPG